MGILWKGGAESKHEYQSLSAKIQGALRNDGLSMDGEAKSGKLVKAIQAGETNAKLLADRFGFHSTAGLYLFVVGKWE